VRALENLTRLCEERLKGQYHIEVVDLLIEPELAKGDQIVAIPTLVRKLPESMKKIIGDLSNTEQVLLWAGISNRTAKSSRPKTRSVALTAAVIFSGLAIGQVRPLSIANDINAELISSLPGSPNEILLAPMVMLSPSFRRTSLMVSRVTRHAPESALTAIARDQ